MGPDQLAKVFACLRKVGACVRRFRFFGTPSFSDAVADLMSRYLGACTADEAPLEIHLSDCALGARGLPSVEAPRSAPLRC